MKTIYNKMKNIVFPIAVLALTLVSCERELSDDVVPATFPTTAEIFTDDPVGLTDQFFRSFDPATGANTEGFDVDNNVAFEGTSSIRIDVPSDTDPNGTYIGGIFEDRGEGRDLTGYDALTFYAKASTTATIGQFGFGNDFGANAYEVNILDVELSTKWRKYVIPIPDASKLVQEKGMFIFAAGSQSTGGNGYTFWIDNLKFENLGNIGQPRPTILGGADADFISTPGQTLNISGFSGTYNLADGQEVTVSTTVNYFQFTSSDTSVATVDDNGLVSVLSTGQAEITATVGGVPVNGSVIVSSFNDQRIISVFSDFYANVPVDNYNGFYEPFQTTLGGLVNENGNNIIDYTNLNFVATEFYGRQNPNAVPIDATEMTNLNIDFRVNGPVSPTDFIRIELINNFGQGNQSSGSYTITGDQLRSGEFVSFNIGLGSFAGLTRDALGAILFVTDGTISNLSIDNIFFSKKVVDPTPNVDDSAATQKEFPLGFESSNVTYNITSFEGADSAIEMNPDQSGINSTATVMRYTKTVNAQFFAGSFIDLDASINFSTSQVVRAKVWSPKANIPIRLALETSGGTNQIFVDANIPVANEWVEVEFDFSGVYNSAISYQRFIVFFEFIDGIRGDGSTYYIDDLKVLN